MSTIDNIILSDIETISKDETITESDPSESFNDDDEIEQVSFFTKFLLITKVIHSAFPVEYLKTSPQGVATIFNISDWPHPMACFNNVNKCLLKLFCDCPFFGVLIKKDVRKCQEVKHCTHADPEIINVQHNEVDLKSDFVKLNQHQNRNSKKIKTYIFYLATQTITCRRKVNDDKICNGNAKLRRVIKNISEEYIIGCNKWKRGEKFHHYTKVSENIDLELLRDLFKDEMYIDGNDNANQQCSTLILYSSRTKLCEYPHIQDGQVIRGTIIERKCDVKFIKFVSYDLSVCPYIALICIGIYNHLPPLPQRTSVSLKDELQTMIQNIISSDDSVTPHSIIAGNSIKATFDKDTISEVHISLNNIDKLRSLIAKCYKNMHPYGQGNLGILYSVQCKKFDMHNYVRCIVYECFEKLDTILSSNLCSSLNKYVSNMENEVWDRYGNNTNVAEAAHSLANREGKQLKLLTAIMRGRRLDERHFKIIETHDKYGVPYTRKDKSEIKRKAMAMIRKETPKESKKMQMKEITNQDKQEKRGVKRKATTSEKSKVKKTVIEIDSEQENQVNEPNEQHILQIEIEGRRMQLAERRTADRKAQAEIERLEASNQFIRKGQWKS
ncbi:hypothetical protein RclHR1_03650019 [Rhizophagus clarus]|uniref:Uncharacterized protein n=1 Tax=Rhizophagus clarus TaxID=94130 RepID=A0A2Z6RCG8_9GLOM|nr:hypothetical protein RclHR1_03650019 [Rhizophagus clarus]